MTTLPSQASDSATIDTFQPLLEAARRVSAIAARVGFQNCERLVVDLHRWCEFLDVVVAGGYSEGKSTFLNALLVLPEAEGLPTDRLPTTKLPWRLHYGRSPTIIAKKGESEIYRLTWQEALKKHDGSAGPPEGVDYYDAEVLSESLDFHRLLLWDTEGFEAPERREGESESISALCDHDVLVWMTSYEVKASCRDLFLSAIAKGNFARVLVVMTNAPGEAPQRFQEKREESLCKVREYFGCDGTDRAAFYAVDSVLAIEGQRDLKAIAGAFHSAVLDFLGNRNPSAIRDDWDKRVGAAIEKIQSSGIVEIREEFGRLVAEPEKYIAIAVTKKLRKRVTGLLEEIDVERQSALTRSDEANAKLAKIRAQCALKVPPGALEHASKRLAEQLHAYLTGRRESLAVELHAMLGEQIKRSQKPVLSIWFWNPDQKERLRRLRKTVPAQVRELVEGERSYLVEQMPKRLHDAISQMLVEDCRNAAMDAGAEGLDLGGVGCFSAGIDAVVGDLGERVKKGLPLPEGQWLEGVCVRLAGDEADAQVIASDLAAECADAAFGGLAKEFRDMPEMYLKCLDAAIQGLRKQLEARFKEQAEDLEDLIRETEKRRRLLQRGHEDLEEILGELCGG